MIGAELVPSLLLSVFDDVSIVAELSSYGITYSSFMAYTLLFHESVASLASDLQLRKSDDVSFGGRHLRRSRRMSSDRAVM